MPTETEELQAKEFLKRAEVKTMRKDLQSLRETDALSERDKIAKIKTLEEQRLEQEKKIREIEAAHQETQKLEREEVLTKNENQERLAEKDLKEYALEPEKQQVFLFESQRIGFEKQAEIIDKQKDPAFKLQKNRLMLQQREWQTKLNAILAQEKKFEDEQKFVAEKAQTSAIATEKKSLEQRRWEIDKDIQDIEKKRWEAEKQIQDIENKTKEIDKSFLQLTAERGELKEKILGIDKSLREIYSGVMARVEEKRRGEAEDQKKTREGAAKIRAGEKETIQRQQWTHSAGLQSERGKEFLKNAPASLQEKLAKTAGAEEEQRKKFMQNVENWAEDKNNSQQPKEHTASELPIPPKKYN